MPGPAKSLSKKSLGLPPIDKYLLSGWDEFLFQYGQQFLCSGRVLVLGGYYGRTTSEWLKRGAAQVTVFEPVPAFFEKIEELSESDNRIHLVRSAAGNAEGKIAIHLDGDRSSHPKLVGATQEWVTQKDLNSWIVEYGGTFNVTEINIEGAEYSLITGLKVETLRRLGTILLQTHEIGPETDHKLSALDEKLRESHVKAFSFRHVWSAWVPKNPM